MNTQNDQEIGSPEDTAAQAAAFEASYEGVATPAAPEVKPEPVAEKVEPAPVIEDAAPTAPSPKPETPDYALEIRKLNGRIGSLNDQLQQALKSKEAEGKPAVLTTRELTRMKAEFPEMASLLEQDLAEAMSNVSGSKPDPKEIETLVSSRVKEEMHTIRLEAVTDRHENWASDLWAVQPTLDQPGIPTPAYSEWLKTMTEAEVLAFESSQSPAFVNRKLDQFYDWKSKTAKAEQAKQSRLKASITPQGTARAGPQTVSDAEAERKAFEDAYNS